MNAHVDITKLTAKNYIAWLRKQVRLYGRSSVIGNIGLSYNRPMDAWLQELTGSEHLTVTSCDGFEMDNTRYYLDQQFQDYSICAIDYDVEWGVDSKEITAWDALQDALQYLKAEDMLVGHSEPAYAEVVEVVAVEAMPTITLSDDLWANIEVVQEVRTIVTPGPVQVTAKHNAIVTYSEWRGKLEAKILFDNARTSEYLGRFETVEDIETAALKRAKAVTFVLPNRFLQEIRCA